MNTKSSQLRRAIVVVVAVSSIAGVGHAQGPNPTNLWLVDLKWTGNRLTAGTPVKLTHDDGTNSQPSFTPDGRAIVFSATRDTGSNARSDIYRIDLATRAETRVTHTPENENSPTVNERGEYVAVRWIPATLFKEFGPWVYSPDGTPTHGILRGPDTTGYYTPLPNGDYALTRPKSKTFTLGLFDAKSGAIVDVDSGLPALPAVRIPGERALSYVRIDSVDGRHVLRRLDLSSHATTSLGPTVIGRTAHAWVAGHKTMLMAKGNVLYARTPDEPSWRAIATFDSPELRNASAYVVSAAGDKLILTSPKRLAFAIVLRDSLDVGRSGADVRAMVVAWRDAGTLADMDVTEGPIGALGDDRVQKKRFADAVAIQQLSTILFPQSYRAFGRLGDAQRAAGDSAAAIASYRTALALNPRSTDAERSAAVAIEKKIAGEPPAQTAQARKAVLVTGASSGIGRKITERLASNGFFVYAGARSQKDIDDLNAVPNVQALRLDVTAASDIAAAVATVTKAGRGLFGVVNNAGVVVVAPLIEAEEKDVDFIFNVNLYGPYRITKAFAPLLLESKGRVVNISSLNGIVASPMIGFYSMSKHAVEAFGDGLAAELSRFGVRVSLIEPGNYGTEIGRNMLARMDTAIVKGSRFEPQMRATINQMRAFESNPPPDAVADAALDAFTSANPRSRYLVVPVANQGAVAIRKLIDEVVQLNESSKFSVDRDSLVKLLDDALARSKRVR